MFSKLFKSSNKYKVGQVWKYKTRDGEENSTFTIVAMEEHEKLGTIINIYVEDVKISAIGNDEYITRIQHLPFSKEAIDLSATKLQGKRNDLPDYEEGYNSWREEFTKGDAGVFTITVREAVEYMEEALNN